MSTLALPIIVSIALIFAGTYFIFLHGTNRRKLLLPGSSPQALRQGTLLMTQKSDFPSLIDRPVAGNIEDFEVTLGDSYEDEESDVEFVDTEESRLLKEAEKVVSEIQEVVDNIASYPPNPEEVKSKVRNVLKQYSIFQNTEYYEAINNFVALTVERDCKVSFRKDELPTLWN